MSVSADILRSWRHPRRVVARLLGMGVREDRALVFLMAGCGLIFLAQWPRLLREAAAMPGPGFDARVGGALWGWLFVMPLLAYGLAALSHLIARMLGGRGSWFGARLALFWAFLASAPLWLLNGALTGLFGSGAASLLSGLLALGAWLAIWLAGLIEAERGAGAQQGGGGTEASAGGSAADAGAGARP